MTRYFVRATGGSDSNNGLSYAAAFATPNHFEALPPVAGDELVYAPGVYRLTATIAVSGGSVYTTGTVSVTNGSAIITGSGTAWLANAFVNGKFQVTQLAHAADGVANGTTTFTSATGNFQAGHIGQAIRITGKAGPFTIVSINSLTSVILSGSPTAGSSLTYDIGPESPYNIASVDSNTQITLSAAWAGPTLTGLAYTAWNDIKYTADEGGTLTDGIGGEIRITGSDDDKTITRANCIVDSAHSYRTFTGIHVDYASGVLINLTNSTFFIIDKLVGNGGTVFVQIQGTSELAVTISRCLVFIASNAVLISVASTADNRANLIENCIFIGAAATNAGALRLQRAGGVKLRSSLIIGYSQGISGSISPATGQFNECYDCIFYGNLTGIVNVAAADMYEDYNNLFACATTRTNTTAGAHDQSYPPIFANPLLMLGIHIPITFNLSSQSQIASIASFDVPIDDIFSIVRPGTPSWGPVQYTANQRPSDTGSSRGRRGDD